MGTENLHGEAGQWTIERARAWYCRLPWLVGCNYLPANAINQLENPLKLQSVKRDIARVKTILRERELKGIRE